MTTAREARAALVLVTAAAVNDAEALTRRLRGSAATQRSALLETVPGVIAYYSDGAAALAADYYEDERDAAGVGGRFRATPVVVDRTVKIRTSIAWATEPLFTEGLDSSLESRLAEVVQFETARPFRDTITTNRQRDPNAVGWRRITNGGCAFCRMLADRGAVYRAASARFAAHPTCKCTAQPVFDNGDPGEEASALQYMASRKSRTPAQRAELRAYLNEFYS